MLTVPLTSGPSLRKGYGVGGIGACYLDLKSDQYKKLKGSYSM